MTKQDGLRWRLGRPAPWVPPLAFVAFIVIFGVGVAVLSTGTEVAIAVVVGLIVQFVIFLLGSLLTSKRR